VIVITGAAGFIGWNLYQSLKHVRDILLVDFSDKFVGDIQPTHPTTDPTQFLEDLENPDFARKIEIVLHQGACSSTTIHDPKYMMGLNFDYSHALFHSCMEHNIRLIYASSASVYGDGPFHECSHLNPKNVYANSKRLFDDYVTAFLDHSNPTQIVGLRYFNVYGPWEETKGKMSSVMCQFKKQIDDYNEVQIFEGSDKFLRDFTYIDDVISVNKHFIENKEISGIFNCATGIAETFSTIPEIMSEYYNFKIKEIPVPPQVIDRYQKFTRADLNKLRTVGKYNKPFISLSGGIKKYVDFWSTHDDNRIY
jgi:ADP-L-glycero-D-manno-heptose 6-epimerase